MRLLEKSNKKYHRSIMKDYRSIIEDARSTRKISLNIARSQFKHRKESKEYCPKKSA